ncbi:GlxA family transcriptional regulator [Arenimonas fontis]|uniref:Helix-turn-helix domain-containing protein n=1 Tax=Arenimonas fontis TaxID=2608255 RepID=A0A5B2Z9A4_9GAMM|nr:helix-turn-helix domain-containing protein [Arenimonas fontis]KAA2284579.1 helix-turn-helix domain-containing protein [Arenimonas fontis]
MTQPIHVSLLAIPEASISTLHGLYDVLGAFPLLRGLDDAIPADPPFRVEIVAERPGPMVLAGGLQAVAQRGIDELDRTGIVIVPSVLLSAEGWKKGRYPALVAWLGRMHARGAMLCSACSGVFLIAEAGLLDGRTVTIHWTYAGHFADLYPRVLLRPEQPLVVSGERAELVSSGASMSWHDLVLYLIAREAGPAVAQSAARFFALQWHRDGLGPYIVFEGRRDHGDAVILEAQRWLERNYPVPSPVEKMAQRTGLAERTFKRRFQAATGLAPLAYVQRLRVEEAKRRLERTAEPVDEVGWRVGYEDPAFFRRLFRRVTGITPGQYRRKFQLPVPAG